MSSKKFTLHGFGRTALKLSVSDDGTCSTFAIASVGGEIRVTMHEWVIASVAYNANKHRPEILTEFEQSGFSELARQVRNHPFYQNPEFDPSDASRYRQYQVVPDNIKGRAHIKITPQIKENLHKVATENAKSIL